MTKRLRPSPAATARAFTTISCRQAVPPAGAGLPAALPPLTGTRDPAILAADQRRNVSASKNMLPAGYGSKVVPGGVAAWRCPGLCRRQAIKQPGDREQVLVHQDRSFLDETASRTV